MKILTLMAFMLVIVWVVYYANRAVTIKKEDIISNTLPDPILRQLLLEARTFDNRLLQLTVNGRQIQNTDAKGWCVYGWTGKIRNIVAFAGTVEVSGQMYVDSWLNKTEEGLPNFIKTELQGTTLESSSCVFDILDVEVRD